MTDDEKMDQLMESYAAKASKPLDGDPESIKDTLEAIVEVWELGEREAKLVSMSLSTLVRLKITDDVEQESSQASLEEWAA